MTTAYQRIRGRLDSREPVLLDGPMGSELVRRGVRWRKHGLLTDTDAVLRLHEEYLAAGAQVLRGGAFKPRTSPYAFQGLGEPGLAILRDVGREVRMPVVSEALDERSLDLVIEYCDMIQIGARNMQNYSLLRMVGRVAKPVLLKRGMAATVEELLMAAEYVLAEGNYQVVLCERGIRTFTDHTRNTLDLAAVVAVQRLSHLPIIVDPSHATGRRHKVVPLARAAAAVEVRALS